MKKNKYISPETKISKVCNTNMLCSSMIITDNPADPNLETLTGKDIWSGNIWE